MDHTVYDDSCTDSLAQGNIDRILNIRRQPKLCCRCRLRVVHQMAWIGQISGKIRQRSRGIVHQFCINNLLPIGRYQTLNGDTDTQNFVRRNVKRINKLQNPIAECPIIGIFITIFQRHPLYGNNLPQQIYCTHAQMLTGSLHADGNAAAGHTGDHLGLTAAGRRKISLLFDQTHFFQFFQVMGNCGQTKSQRCRNVLLAGLTGPVNQIEYSASILHFQICDRKIVHLFLPCVASLRFTTLLPTHLPPRYSRFCVVHAFSYAPCLLCASRFFNCLLYYTTLSYLCKHIRYVLLTTGTVKRTIK